MKHLTATLLADGSSDRVLLRMIDFVLDEYCPDPFTTAFAEELDTPSRTLSERIQKAQELYPCHLLFVHRDAEKESVNKREQEIHEAMRVNSQLPFIYIIPVRMTETWLLLDEQAIRKAACNPNGASKLDIPKANKLESHTDPKAMVFAALEKATELPPNRLRRFDRNRARLQISGFISDCSVLRQLPSFRHFESQVEKYFLQPNPSC